MHLPVRTAVVNRANTLRTQPRTPMNGPSVYVDRFIGGGNAGRVAADPIDRLVAGVPCNP